jgi:hypothetical protein
MAESSADLIRNTRFCTTIHIYNYIIHITIHVI